MRDPLDIVRAVGGLLRRGAAAVAPWRVGQRTECLEERAAELERANARLAAAVQDREILLREVQHRVKNNLQVICSLLRLQSARLDAGSRRGFDESLRRIQSMSLVHDLLYRSDRPARINYGEYLRALCEQLVRSGGPTAVSVEVRAVDWDLDVDQATPLALIASELVSNALLHAYPTGQSGIVEVCLDRRDGGTALLVRDRGIGLPHAVTSPGAVRRRGLGLILVEALARQVDATVTIDRTGGTTFRLTLPAAGRGLGVTRRV